MTEERKPVLNPLERDLAKELLSGLQKDIKERKVQVAEENRKASNPPSTCGFSNDRTPEKK